MGQLVHGVSLSHEDGRVAHGAAMRQLEEDQVYVQYRIIHHKIPHSDEPR